MIEHKLNENVYDLIKIYMLEEQYFLESHQKRVVFFVSAIMAIIAATVAGIARLEPSFATLGLLFGPASIFILSHFGKDGTYRFYQRFIETVTVKAKLQNIAGLDQSGAPFSQDFNWIDEPIIPRRHVEATENFESSDEFKLKVDRLGYQSVVERLFFALKTLSAALAVYIMVWSVDIVAVGKLFIEFNARSEMMRLKI